MIPFIDVIGSVIGKVLDKIPDAGQKAQLQLEITKELDRNQEAILSSLTAVDVKQAEVNAEEAKSNSLFKSGWRPMIAWICGAAFAWTYVIQPIVVFCFVVAGKPPIGLPEINIGEMMPILLGMLGLSGLRSFEKSKGVESK